MHYVEELTYNQDNLASNKESKAESWHYGTICMCLSNYTNTNAHKKYKHATLNFVTISPKGDFCYMLIGNSQGTDKIDHTWTICQMNVTRMIHTKLYSHEDTLMPWSCASCITFLHIRIIVPISEKALLIGGVLLGGPSPRPQTSTITSLSANYLNPARTERRNQLARWRQAEYQESEFTGKARFVGWDLLCDNSSFSDSVVYRRYYGAHLAWQPPPSWHGCLFLAKGNNPNFSSSDFRTLVPATFIMVMSLLLYLSPTLLHPLLLS